MRFHRLTMLPLLLLSAILPVTLSFSSSMYGQVFRGDGTYYGATEGGHCSLKRPRPGMYDGFVPVALNTAQYGDSLPCGACIEFTGTGRGSGASPIRGTQKGYVMDSCPSCGYGDIDLSVSGDGRWEVAWRFIDCPGNNVFFQMQGSHEWYKKIQPRGSEMPVEQLMINGKPGTRTPDNFFEVHGHMKAPMTVTMTLMDGKKITARLSYMVGDGMIYPESTSSGGGDGGNEQGNQGGRSKRRVPPRRNKKKGSCIPHWRSCAGKANSGRKGKCCGNFVCEAKRNGRGKYVGKRCQPKRGGDGRKKCVPRWRPCSGRKNVWGTSRCCGRFVCKRTKKDRRGYKRCRPKRRH